MAHFRKDLPLLVLTLLAGCYSMPDGPTVTALQGDAKSSSEFRADTVDCRQYAQALAADWTLRSPDPAGWSTSARPGTAASAAADGRDSTAVGGGTGSVIDGLDAAQFAGFGPQKIYNRAYIRCMYIKGNKVTVLAQERWPAPRSPWPPDPAAYYSPLER